MLHGVAGESADIVVRENVGEVFEPENAQQLVDGLLRMRDQPEAYSSYQQNGLAAAIRYDRKHLGLKMLQVFNDLIGK